MTIQNPEKIHYRTGDSYLCNRACYITASKCTQNTGEVTCKNCKRELLRKISCKKCGFEFTDYALEKNIKETGLCIKCFREAENG